MAVAPSSTYVEPTTTVVINPVVVPSVVAKATPSPRIVMVGRVLSGIVAAVAVAVAAAVVSME